jgi:hypothetical protein
VRIDGKVSLFGKQTVAGVELFRPTSSIDALDLLDPSPIGYKAKPI